MMKLCCALAVAVAVSGFAGQGVAAGPSGSEWIINYQGKNKDVITLVSAFNQTGSKCVQGKKVKPEELAKLEGIATQMAKQPYAKVPDEGMALSEVISGVGWMRQLCSK